MLELNNVSYRYEGAAQNALSGVTMTIEAGEMLAIVGHNGSGKSTLAKHLNGLLLPTGGNVTIDGMDTKNEDALLAIRQRVGMVFQNPDNQLVTTIVEEDVGFGPENLGVPPKEIRGRVDAALESVGMPFPTRFRGARNSASPLPACLRCSRRCSCWTKRPRCSTRRGGARCWRS